MHYCDLGGRNMGLTQNTSSWCGLVEICAVILKLFNAWQIYSPDTNLCTYNLWLWSREPSKYKCDLDLWRRTVVLERDTTLSCDRHLYSYFKTPQCMTKLVWTRFFVQVGTHMSIVLMRLTFVQLFLNPSMHDKVTVRTKMCVPINSCDSETMFDI
jgi:hypothetical protein